MKVDGQFFNTILTLTLLAGLCGCQTSRKNKEVSALRIHIETGATGPGVSRTVSVLRANPVPISIEPQPVLTEAGIVEAKVIDARGGFAIQIQFDESSTLVLEQYSAANPGKHFVIFGQWGEKPADGRWLAAPLITHRITDGSLAFTPDMTRPEADRLVLGLNNVAKKIRKGQLK